MVAKKSRITPKPKAVDPAAAEAFLGSLGTDPESTLPPPAAAPPATPEIAASDEGKGKPFPHRLSADFAKNQYRRLKRAAFETELPMTEILRDALEDWLKARGY